MLIVLVLFSLILSACWIFLDYRNYISLNLCLLRKKFIHQPKELIRTEVARTLDYINFHIELMQYSVRDAIRRRVREAHAIASGLIDDHGETTNAEELERIVRDAIRPIRYYGISGHLFAISIDGYEQLVVNRSINTAATDSDTGSGAGSGSRSQSGIYHRYRLFRYRNYWQTSANIKFWPS